MKNEKNYMGLFFITKIWQIFKRFSRALSWVQTSYFCRVMWCCITSSYYLYLLKGPRRQFTHSLDVPCCSILASFSSTGLVLSIELPSARSLSHYVRFSLFYWHFSANFVIHIRSMLQVCIIAIWSQGIILNLERSYATFGTQTPVFRANSGCRLGKE